jgi:hypothetical protein
MKFIDLSIDERQDILAHAFKARIYLAQMTDGRKQTCQK